MLAGCNPFDVFQEDDDVDIDETIYRRIVTKSSLNYKWWMTSDSVDVIEKFLQLDPSKRLGCQQPDGFEELKRHDFFKAFNFHQLYCRCVTPPMIPKLMDENDVSNFSSSFTEQAPVLETDYPCETEVIDQSLFVGFDCVNTCYT
ncbi:protein kinase C zeta type-like [Cephus cinctus]|uniref:Protein kinase C zeta type-like n=1 Tax=Cephus cinctus TaxID=211228 RepID=A0AAJ7RB62_CEPCN|nr:protein kinase C zeta type-like [Cephus cinctus]